MAITPKPIKPIPVDHPPVLSPATAEFLLMLVNRLTLSVEDPQFEEMAAKVIRAKKELEKAVQSTFAP